MAAAKLEPSGAEAVGFVGQYPWGLGVCERRTIFDDKANDIGLGFGPLVFIFAREHKGNCDLMGSDGRNGAPGLRRCLLAKLLNHHPNNKRAHQTDADEEF